MGVLDTTWGMFIIGETISRKKGESQMTNSNLEDQYVDDNYYVTNHKHTIEEQDETTITDSDWDGYYHNITQEIDEKLTIDQ